MSKVKVAIAGCGSCAAAFVTGCAWYAGRMGDGLEMGRGLLTGQIGPYGPGSVEVVAAFDVNADKVGRPLSDAIFMPPNVFPRPEWLQALLALRLEDVIVQPGPVLDGVGASYSELVPRVDRSGTALTVAEELRRTEADVLVSYMPVGSDRATLAYADAALEAGVAMVNPVPCYLAKNELYAETFRRAGLPLIGDDAKGQVGATVIHRALAALFSERGAWLDRTTQENWGDERSGDFVNMKDEERLVTKRESKTVAVTSVANRGNGLPPDAVSIGPSGTRPGLGDDKEARIVLEGTGFGGNQLRIELEYRGGDSPNSAAVVYDAVRHAKVALDRGVGGPLRNACAYLMKSPPVPSIPDEAAHEMAVADAADWARPGSRLRSV